MWAVAREPGGLAGAGPSNFLAGGALVMYLSPRNSRNRGLLRSTDTMSQLTSRNTYSPEVASYVLLFAICAGTGRGQWGQFALTLGPCGRCPQTVSPNRVVTFYIFASFLSVKRPKGEK